MTDPIVVVGDSQIRALAEGVEEQGLNDCIKAVMVAGGFAFFIPFFSDDQYGVKFTSPVGQARLDAVTGSTSLETFKGRLATTIGLSSAPFYGTLNKQRITFSPLEPLPRFAYVSSAAIDRSIADLQRHAVAFYRACIRDNLLLAAVAGAPPQRRHPAYAIYGEDLPDISRRFQMPIRDIMQESGLPVIQPEGATDAQGFLLEDCWGSDFSHGNSRYGKLVASDLQALRPDAGVQAP